MIEEYLEDYYGENKRKPQKRRKVRTSEKTVPALSEEQIDEIHFQTRSREKGRRSK